jgi:hypothetical protein
MKKILIFLFLNLLIFSKALANNYAPEIIFSCIKKNSQKIDYYGFKKINNNYVISRYNHKSKKFYSSYSVLYTNENNMMWDYYSPIHGLIATYYFRSNNFSNEIIMGGKILLSTSNNRLKKKIKKFGKRQDLLKFKGDDSNNHYNSLFKLNDELATFKFNLKKDISFSKTDIGTPTKTCNKGFIKK